jgi:hypothetical protein
MAKHQILNRWTDQVLFECDVPDELASGLRSRHALEQAVAARANLSDADLRGADLRDADLRDANLRDADLRGADLRDADLRGADLRDAYLRDADLRGADLRDADLRDANLRDADLRGADLRDANLRDADLRGADLRDADLSPIKADFFDVLLRAPREISGLRAALVGGRVDGSTYEGECACLVGTIAHVRGGQYDALGNGLKPDSGRPIERFFMSIRKGDTPETNPASKLAVEWLDELTGLLTSATAQEVA